MKYFVLYTASDQYNAEYFLKGKSVEHMEKRILFYSDGILSTNKWTLVTSNVECGYLREVSLTEYPDLKKRDYAIINENNSYSESELLNITPF
jgi:hypothetical protein